MRRQFHFRPSAKGFDAWDVHRLVGLSSELPVERVALADIAEIDEPYWYYTGEVPTCRSLASHTRLINEADLSYPIILCAEGRVMDGMHRVTKALIEGRQDIACVRFQHTPSPDYRDVQPSDLF